MKDLDRKLLHLHYFLLPCLTDSQIYYKRLAFIYKCQVILDGCPKITEKGLMAFKRVKKLHLSLKATGVSFYPQAVHHHSCVMTNSPMLNIKAYTDSAG